MAGVSGADGGIRVVLFDLDDTLLAHREASDSAIVAHARATGWTVADEVAEQRRWLDLEERHYHRYLAGELHFLEQRWVRARAFAAPYGLELDDAAANAWFDGYLVHVQRHWALHADALPCLDALDDRPIGIITNGAIGFQTSKLTAVGIRDRIAHVVASGEFGVAKPDPAIFRHACELFGVEPTAAVYVGDRLGTDALGAAAAGMLGVWIDRRDVATAADRAAAAAAGARIIRSLDELPALLGAAESTS